LLNANLLWIGFAGCVPVAIVKKGMSTVLRSSHAIIVTSLAF
jgi:hypothetical protein